MKRVYAFLLGFMTAAGMISCPAGAALPAKVVSVRPEAMAHLKDTAVPARVADRIDRGTTLETGDSGRISLLLPDRMLLKIDSDTLFVYGPDGPGPAVSGGQAHGTVKRGRVWLRGHKKGQAFTVETPGAVAAIRGTEWYVEVDDDQTTRVGVLDGQVAVSNAFGSLLLQSRELAVVKKGFPPVRARYLVPDNAVNWTLNYYGFWDKSDIARAGNGFEKSVQEALNAYARDDLDTGFHILAAARETYGSTAAWWALNGFIHMVSGQDAAASDAFVRAADIDPSWALPPAHLALMRLAENRMEQAAGLAQTAVEREPSSSVAWIAAAHVRKARLDLDSAYEYARKAVALSPGFDPALIVAARIALEMDDVYECRALLDRISPESSVCPEKYTYLGFISLRNGRSAQALAHFSRAVDLEPEAADAWIGKGIALFNVNRKTEGIEAIIQATLMAPQVSAYQSYLAKAFLETRAWDDAQKSLGRARRLDSKDPTSFLYEALKLFENHEPGKAVLALDQAVALNGNRAVFRSEYLLDQDSAVLMSNVSNLYDELGFDSSAILSASRAVETDPLNAAAWRRLFFSDIFASGTRPLHPQVMETEKLLAKLLVPPTLNSLIFIPGGLSAYQPMFVRSGVDMVVSGSQVHQETETGKLDMSTGFLSVTAKPDYPAAAFVSVMPNQSRTESRAGRPPVFSGADSDGDTCNTQTTVKYRVTPSLDLFADLATSGSDAESGSWSASRTSVTSSMGYLGDVTVDTDFRSQLSSGTDADLYDFDAGAHLNLRQSFHVLVHAGMGKETNDFSSITHTETATTTGYSSGWFPPQTLVDGSTSSAGVQTDDRYRIGQAVIWKKGGDHFFETGVRQFSGNSETSGSNGWSGIEKSVSSFFFSHQYIPADPLTLGWSITHDRASYLTSGGADNTESVTGGYISALWEVTPVWTLRSIVLKNLAGDGKRRLQRPVSAGFPVFSLNSDTVVQNDSGQFFHMIHKTWATGIDFRAAGYPLFSGIEYAVDRADSFVFDIQPPFGRRPSKQDTHRIRAYVETLVSPKLSVGLSAAFSTIDVTGPAGQYHGDLSRAEGTLSWFVNPHITASLTGRAEKTTVNMESEAYSVRPRLNGYFFDNRLRITLEGNIGTRISRNMNDHIKEVSAGFYWYY